MDHLRTKIAAITLAASVAVGAAITIAPVADAQDESAPNDRMQQREERLQAKVDEGAITQERAGEIRARMAERAARRDARQVARAERTSDLAETLGMPADDLVQARRAGTSLAELAADAGVDVDTLIDQIEAARIERINQAVADGRIDQAQADEKLDGLRDQITARVNGETPEGRQGHRHRGLRAGN